MAGPRPATQPTKATYEDQKAKGQNNVVLGESTYFTAEKPVDNSKPKNSTLTGKSYTNPKRFSSGQMGDVIGNSNYSKGENKTTR